jgi:peroxiredoxin
MFFSNAFRVRSVVALVPCVFVAVACNSTPAPKAEPAKGAAALKPAAPTTAAPAAAAPGTAAPATALPAAGSAAKAQLGAPAPDFKLKDLDGKEVQLSSFKGKTVVLEWFNPECPFVKGSHTKGSLKDAAAKHQDVVWLAINSGGSGKQGAGADASKQGVSTFGLKHPVLLDESGQVGRLYGGERTPHLFVVNPAGNLVYRGAVDNSPDAEGQSPKGGTLVNYVDQALAAIQAGKPVETPETAAYGCTVKYGDQS